MMAQQIWRQISRHEYSIKLCAPVTTADRAIMDVTVALFVNGHPIALFSGQYYLHEIVETLGSQAWLAPGNRRLEPPARAERGLSEQRLTVK